MANTRQLSAAPLVVVGRQTGVTIIPAQTQLTRLNYFDGKFLRAQDLQAEQRYLMNLVQLSNRAGGFGVVHGFDLNLAGGDQLRLGAGLAIDPQGRVLMLPQEHTVSIQELIDRSRESLRRMQAGAPSAVGGFEPCEQVSEAPASTPVPGRDWWLVTIAHAEALCGEEDVYGKLCEEACVTSTDRPYRLEGVVLRVTPLQLATPLAHSSAVALERTHLRSLIGSAYFADEARRVGDLLSRAGLESAVWCAGAPAVGGNEVPIGVLVRESGATLFLDEWTARRERIDAPPKRYWQWRMRMRPWDVFLAQILQFQCQLHDVFAHAVPDGGSDDPCAQAKELVVEAADHIKVLAGFYRDTSAKISKMAASTRERLLAGMSVSAGSVEKLALFQDRLASLTQAFRIMPQERLLIRGGIVEMPAAGYLPVVPGSSISVNQQVRRMLGEGVDLRYCIVRPDFPAHALEEAQHMERISLLEGLDHPQRKPKVDVLVPDGKVAPGRDETGRHYEMRMNIDPDNVELLALAAGRALQSGAGKAVDAAALLKAYLAALGGNQQNLETFEYSGVARSQTESGGGMSFHYAGGTRSFILGPDRPATTTTATAAATATGAATETVSGARLEAMTRMLRLEAAVKPETRSSIWTSLNIERNPMQLTRGQSVRVKGETYLLVAMEARANAATASNAVVRAPTHSVLLRIGFTGEFQAEEPARRAAAADLIEASGALSGELGVSLSREGQQSSYSAFVSENVRVRRTMGEHGPAYRIEMPDPTVLQPFVAELQVRREWDSPTEAQALGLMFFRVLKQAQAVAARSLIDAAHLAVAPALDLGALFGSNTTTRQRQAFHAWQTVNAAVREPNHPAHESAIRALRSIGLAIGSTKFADLAAVRLFPAPAPSSDLTVLATLDWVLFHRRRDKMCQHEVPIVPIETRHYALYHVELTGDQSVADLAKLLQQTGTRRARVPALDFIQIVEFGAGIHAVLSPHVRVQASWRQDVGADAGSIQGGLIASRGVAAAEGEPLAHARLESLVDVVAAVSHVDLNPDYKVLDRVPDALDVPSNDGVLIVATRRAVATNCHNVFAARDQNTLKLLAEAAQAGRFLATLQNNKLALELGKVNFSGVTPDQTMLDAMKTSWDAHNLGVGAQGLVAANANDAAAGSYVPQGATILAALGGSGNPTAVTTTEQMPDCPAITVIAASQVVRSALLIYTNWDNGDHFISAGAPPPNSSMDFRNDVPQGDALTNFVASLTANQPVLGVTLATTMAAPDAGATARLKEVVKALDDAGKNKTSASRIVAQALSEHDRKELEGNAFVPDNFHEVIFFELNAS